MSMIVIKVQKYVHSIFLILESNMLCLGMQWKCVFKVDKSFMFSEWGRAGFWHTLACAS